MRIKWQDFTVITILFILAASWAQAQVNPNTSVSQKTAVSKQYTSQRQHAVYVEALGRGGIYSVGYEYHPSRRASLGIGYSYQSLQLKPTAIDSKIQLQTFPIYSSLYFPFGAHRPYISAGATGLWVKSSADVKFNDLISQFSFESKKNQEQADTYTAAVDIADSKNSAEIFLAIPNLAAGYEYKMLSGAFSRAQVIGFITDKPIIWLGISFGIGF